MDPLDPIILKINTHIAFSKGKVGINVIVINYLGVSLLAKAIPQLGGYSVDFGRTPRDH